MLDTNLKFYTSWTTQLKTIVTMSPWPFKLFDICGPRGPDL